MSFNPQIWSAETHRQLKAKLAGSKRVISTIVDYTQHCRGVRADAYNGPMLGSLQAMQMPIADEHFTSLSKAVFNMPLNNQVGVPVQIKDLEEVQSKLNLRQNYAEMASEGLLDYYDLAVTKVMLDGVNVANRIKKTDTDKNQLTLADFITARKELNKAGAPATGRTALINADDEASLVLIPEFISRDKLPNTKAILEGIVGRVLGFDVILNPNQPKVYATEGNYGAGAGTKKVNLFYHKNVCGFGRQKEFQVVEQTHAGSASKFVNTWSNYGAKMHPASGGKHDFSKFAVSIRDN